MMHEINKGMNPVYMKGKFTLFILAFLAASLSATGQVKPIENIPQLKENQTYEIWSSAHSSGYTDGGFLRKKRYFEKDEIYISNYSFIESLPIEAKKIIANYTSQITYLFDVDTDRELAQALGGFSSLAESRETLLKDWTQRIPDYGPYHLAIRRSGNTLFFDLSSSFGSAKVSDTFQIDSQGTITYIAERLQYITYNNRRIFEKYQGYIIKLNGEKINIGSTFLDPDNIESVSVSERQHTVSIVQKEKNPKYFSLSDIDITKLSFTVKSIKEVRLIYIDDGTAFSRDYYEGTKIETSAIHSIGSGKDEEYDQPWIVIKLK